MKASLNSDPGSPTDWLCDLHTFLPGTSVFSSVNGVDLICSIIERI